MVIQCTKYDAGIKKLVALRRPTWSRALAAVFGAKSG
jgi:hypothetical protein